MARRDAFSSRGLMLWTLFCLLVCSLGVVANASAATTWTVISLADTNTGSSHSGTLRWVIGQAANGDAINFQSGLTGTIGLTAALPAIAVDITIDGPGATVITVSGSSSTTVGTIFTIDSGKTVTISGLTISNGKASSSDTGGGGILNNGTLTVNGCTITNNSAASSINNQGGGIFNGGTLNLYSSTVSDNKALDGAGIFNADGGTVTIVNSTFSGNAATTNGGGIYNSATGTTLTLTNSTISNNQATTGGGGIYNASGGKLTVTNSIVAGNTASSNDDIDGIDTDGGGNTITPTTPINLAALANNSRNQTNQTWTLLPLPGSPALCAGDPLKVPSGVTIDQRGFTIGLSETTYCGNGKIDSGAVQTFYMAPQFAKTEYIGQINTTVSFPAAPTVLVMENNLSQDGVVINPTGMPTPPVALTFVGTGTASGLGQETTGASGAGTGAIFAAIQVDEAGSDTLNASLTPTTGATPLTASATLKIVTMTPAAGALPDATQGANYSVTFTASGGLSYTYVLNPMPPGLNFDQSAGTLSGKPTAQGTFDFTVKATDSSSGFSFSQNYSLTVNAPVTAMTTKSPISLTVNQPSVSVMPVTGSGGTGTLTYAMSPTTPLPAGLSINTSGTITGSPQFTSPATNYTVVVTDVNSSTASANFSLTVNSAVVATTVIPSKILTQNQPHVTAFAPVTGSGGTTPPPLTYSMSPTTPLPMGMSISPSTGAISGIPTVPAATANYTVVVTDSNGATASAIFSLTVNIKVTATAASPSTYTLTQNQPSANFTPVTGSGGTTPPPLTYAMSQTTPLPANLVINSSTGAITGVPASPSSAANYTVVVTDVNGGTASANFTLTVSTKVVATATPPATYRLTQNQPSANFIPVTGSGGTGTLKFSMLSTTPLPANLVISSTGAITGVPASSSSAKTYTVVVTDANGATGTANFTLTVSAMVTAAATPPATYTLTQNQLITPFMPVTGSGGTTPPALTYSMSTATPLPKGLTMGSTGMISGNPTVSAAAMSYTVVVTDANDATATANFSLTVSTKVVATANQPATYTLTQNQPSANFMPVTGSGGTGTLTYAMWPTTPLPANLVISSGGAITGIPASPSSAATYTVVVTDANGATATANFMLAVSTKVVATATPPATYTLTQNQPSANFIPVTGSGGTGTRKFTLSPATPLPMGLSISPSGTITGVPSAAAAANNYTVTVTDVNGATAAASFTLTVNAKVVATTAIASTTLTVQPANPANFMPVTGSGGTGPFKYAMSPNTPLPAGLTMSSSGAITGGTAISSAATSYTVVVTDTNGATATANFSLIVQDFSLTLPASGQLTVTQSFTNASDPVSPEKLSVTVTSISGFATASGAPLLITGKFDILSAPNGATTPVFPNVTAVISPSNSAQNVVPLTIDATGATPGAYSLTVYAQDSTTGAMRKTTTSFTVFVSSYTPNLQVASGGSTSTMVSFILPPKTEVPLNCSFAVVGTNLTPVPTSDIPITCAANPNSIGSSSAASDQSVQVTVTINAGAVTTAELTRQTSAFLAGLLGIPILALVGFLSRGKKQQRNFFRFLCVIFMAALVLQAVGCGGNFTSNAKGGAVVNPTPVGTYYLLVQGPGTDNTKQPYQAVVQVNVFR